jgi:hypothetical protein
MLVAVYHRLWGGNSSVMPNVMHPIVYVDGCADESSDQMERYYLMWKTIECNLCLID